MIFRTLGSLGSSDDLVGVVDNHGMTEVAKCWTGLEQLERATRELKLFYFGMLYKWDNFKSEFVKK